MNIDFEYLWTRVLDKIQAKYDQYIEDMHVAKDGRMYATIAQVEMKNLLNFMNEIYEEEEDRCINATKISRPN